MANELINLKIQNREKIVYDADVSSISSINDKGKFDILPQHANFISLIKDEVIVMGKDGSEQKFPITQGVIRVFQNSVKIFLGIGE